MSSSIDKLRDEHRSLVVGSEIAELLDRVVRATAPTYPATEYGAEGGWTAEALEDLLHDWVAERLLARGDLAVMLRTSGSVASLRASLTTSLSQFLINRRRRTSASNLYRRVLAMLRNETEFKPITGASRAPADQLWTLASARWESSSSLALADLVQLANQLSDDELGVVRYGPFSLKSSPILREPALREFLRFMFEQASGGLTLSMIADVMRRRFRLFELADVTLDDSLETTDVPVPLQAEHEAAAASVVARMGETGAAAIRAFEETDGDFASAGATIGGDAADGERAVTEVLGLIADFAISAEDARSIYARVVEKLF